MADMDDDEVFHDDFICALCLDLMYKPVVLACGHISCLWCSVSAMEGSGESRCPICRDTYNHLPRICGLINDSLHKLYPSAYERRATQLAAEHPEFGVSHEFCRNESANSEKKLLVSDLECDSCKQLLYRPSVYHCGHVYCDSCVNPDDNGVYKCLRCECEHPKGRPNVCLILHQFLEEYIPQQYSARKESSSAHGHRSPCQSHHATPSSISRSRQGGYHPHIGCDYCGMHPIFGIRYRCRDCVGSVSFDLCESCHEGSSKLPAASPGRFNQPHAQDHHFEIIDPTDYLIKITIVIETSGGGGGDGDDDDDDDDDDDGEVTDASVPIPIVEEPSEDNEE